MSWIQDLVKPKTRRWEEFYRNRWQHDNVVRSTHGVNCTGGCSWNVYVKDGIVTWEMQALDYPLLESNLPPYEPRGCQRGISASWYVYSPIRVKYPYIRGALVDLWRAERRDKGPIAAWAAIQDDPAKRERIQSARGKGGFRRTTWDEVLDIIAAACLHTAKKWGPDRVFGFSPIPAMSYLSYAGGSRFLQLFGGVNMSFYDWYADLPNAFPEVWGEQTDVCESADWYNSKFIVSMGSNLNMTRTPDVHFISEARHEGAKFVVISPDFSQVAKYADWWIPVEAGQDTALWMAVNHVVLNEFHAERQVPYFLDYLKRYTDCPFLVELHETDEGLKPGQFLRAGRVESLRPGRERRLEDAHVGRGRRCAANAEGVDRLPLGEGGDGQVEPEARGRPRRHAHRPGPQLPRRRRAPRSRRSCSTSSRPTRRSRAACPCGESRPRTAGTRSSPPSTTSCSRSSASAAGFPATTRRATTTIGPYTPAWQEQYTNIGRDTVIQFAREFAANAEATNGKSMVIIGASINHWYNNNLSYRAPITALLLCGCCGVNGGGMNHYVGQEKLTLFAPWTALAFGLDWQKPPRQQQSPTWHYVELATSGATRATSPTTRPSRRRRSGRRATPWTSRPWPCAWVGCPSTRSSTAIRSSSPARQRLREPPLPRRSPTGRATALPRATSASRSTIRTRPRTGRASGSSGAATPSRRAPRDTSSSFATTSARTTTSWRRSTRRTRSRPSPSASPHPAGRWISSSTSTSAWTRRRSTRTSSCRRRAGTRRTTSTRPTSTRSSTRLQAAVPPVWESKTDWEIFKAFAKKVSELAPSVFGYKPVKDIVWTPLAHDTPDELAQPQVLDWRAGECEPIPGKTMPHVRVVERDYANLYNRFVSLGPGIRENGLSAHGITIPVAAVYDELMDEPGRRLARPSPHALRRVGREALSEPRGRARRCERDPRTRAGDERRGLVARVRAEEKKTGLVLTDLAEGNRNVRTTFGDLAAQPQPHARSAPCWTGIVNDGRAYAAWCMNVERLIPWRTLGGRQHFYVDHPYYLDFGEHLPTYKPKLDPRKTGDIVMSPTGEDTLVLNYITPHGKWHIHSTFGDTHRMMTLVARDRAVLDQRQGRSPHRSRGQRLGRGLQRQRGDGHARRRVLARPARDLHDLPRSRADAHDPEVAGAGEQARRSAQLPHAHSHQPGRARRRVRAVHVRVQLLGPDRGLHRDTYAVVKKLERLVW